MGVVRLVVHGLLYFVVGLSLVACATAQQPKPKPERDWSFSELEGRPGVLGTADFIWLGDADVPVAQLDVGRAVGVFLVRSEVGPQYGIATLARTDHGSTILVTAKHVVFDRESGSPKGDTGLFVRPGKSPIEVDLSRFSANGGAFGPEEDLLSVDFPEGNDLDFPDIRVSAPKDLSNFDADDLRPFAISLVSIKGKFRHALRDQVRLFSSNHLEFPGVGIDLDLVKGMSGTPIFVQDGTSTTIVAIAVGGTALPICPDVTDGFCQNGAILLDPVWAKLLTELD